MVKPMFVWLGSGRARKRGVGGDGRFLDEATRAGLPVPAGAVVLDEFYRFGRESGLVAGSVERPFIPDTELWHNTLFHSVRLPPFARPVVVRPSFSAARVDESAGNARARRAIDLNDPDAAAAALAGVWAAAHQSGAARADVVILEMLPAAQSGWVTLGEDADRLLPGYDGLPDGLLPRLPARAAPDATLPPFARRLQLLLRGVRRTFDPAPSRVAWADDGAICRLLGIAEQA